jgi:hypothetical protein
VSALNPKGIVFCAACARRLHASPRAPRRFNLVGGTLTASAEICALPAGRPD